MSDNTNLKLADDIEQRTEQFAGALPAHIPVERFKRILITAVNMNPKLLGADRRSFFNAASRAASDGLLPDGRDGALVIYSTKVKERDGQERWVDMVQWMPMVGGIRKKVRNSGEIATWEVHAVYEKDEFDYLLGDEPRIHHKPHLGADRGKLIAAYSVATLKTGEKSREIMSAEEIRHIWRTSSKNKDKQGNPTGPWKDHEAEMFRKTVARRHSKVLPMSTDLDDLLRRDDDLYDMKGASDAAIKVEHNSVPRRPQLQDFAEQPMATDIIDAGRADEPETVEPAKAASEAPAAASAKKPTTPSAPAASAEDVKKMCRQEGKLAYQDGKPRTEIPPKVTAIPNGPAWFEDGWDDEAAMQEGA